LHDGPDTFRAVLFASDDLQNKYDGDFNQYFAVCLAEGRPPIDAMRQKDAASCSFSLLMVI
jgi:hypothetical protein